MTAIGTFTGGATRDLTDEVFWASSDRSVVVVSSSRGRATAVGPGVAFISATAANGVSSSNSGGDARIHVPAELLSIRIVPGKVQLAVGFGRTLDAEGIFEDGSVDDISNSVTWFTDDSSVVEVSNEPGSQGEVIALERGAARISAVDPETGISSAHSGGDAEVTVPGRAVALSIRPSESQLPAGLARTFSVDVTLDDGSLFGLSRRSVEWTSSNPAVATVSNDPSTPGLVTTLAQGETMLSVVHPLTGLRSTDSDADARLTVVPALNDLVSLEVRPRDRSIDLGDTKSMTAIGMFGGGESADLTDHVVWASSNAAVVVVSNDAGSRGRARAVGTGVAFISATVPGVISSTDSDMDARVRVVAELASIRIVPSNVQLPVDFSGAVEAEGTFRDGSVANISNKVDWYTADSLVVEVSNEPGSQGEMTTLKSGVATISAVDQDTGISSTESGGDAVVTVGGRSVALLVSPAESRLPAGLARTFSVNARLDDG